MLFSRSTVLAVVGVMGQAASVAALDNLSFETGGLQNAAPWTKQGNVTFPNQKLGAEDGNKYAKIIAPVQHAGDAAVVNGISQQMTDLVVGTRYVVGVSYAAFGNDGKVDMCYLQPAVSGLPSIDPWNMNTGPFGGSGPGYSRGNFAFVASSTTATLSLTISCSDAPGRTSQITPRVFYLDNLAFAATDTSNGFNLRYTGSDADGQYALVNSTMTSTNGSTIYAVSSQSDASTFYLDPSGSVCTLDSSNNAACLAVALTTPNTLATNYLATVPTSAPYSSGFYWSSVTCTDAYVNSQNYLSCFSGGAFANAPVITTLGYCDAASPGVLQTFMGSQPDVTVGCQPFLWEMVFA